MNKLCSRNTALATAAGRSGCAPVVSQPLAVFPPFDVLILFVPFLALFIFLLLFSPSLLSRVSLLSMFEMSLSRSRRRIRVSHSSSLSLSLRLTSFHPELRYCKLPTCLHCLARFVSSSLQSMIPVSLSVLIPPASFIAPTLASYAAASQNVHGIPRSLPRSSLFESVCRRPNKYQINETAARNLDVLITGV